MKIAAFITLGGLAGENILQELTRYGIDIDAVYVVRPKKRSRLKAFMRKIKTASLRAALQRAVRVVFFEIRQTPSISNKNYSIIDDVYEKEFLISLERKGYDVFLSMSDEIWKKDLFKIPKFGMLNAHPGKVPQYRGLNSIEKMMLFHDELAISGHLIDEGIDTGPVVHFHYFPATKILKNGKIDYQLLNKQQSICMQQSLQKMKNKTYIDTFLEPSNLSL